MNVHKISITTNMYTSTTHSTWCIWRGLWWYTHRYPAHKYYIIYIGGTQAAGQASLSSLTSFNKQKTSTNTSDDECNSSTTLQGKTVYHNQLLQPWGGKFPGPASLSWKRRPAFLWQRRPAFLKSPAFLWQRRPTFLKRPAFLYILYNKE